MHGTQSFALGLKIGEGRSSGGRNVVVLFAFFPFVSFLSFLSFVAFVMVLEFKFSHLFLS